MSTSVLAHDGASHVGDGSVWTLVSMMVFAAFLLVFAVALLRRPKSSVSTPAEIATDRFASGEIDADDFERLIRDGATRKRTDRR